MFRIEIAFFLFIFFSIANVRGNDKNHLLNSNFLQRKASLIKDETPDSLRKNPQLLSNIIYVELLGNGGYMSLNYEYLFNNSFDLRIGYGFMPLTNLPGDQTLVVSAPVILGLAQYFYHLTTTFFIEGG